MRYKVGHTIPAQRWSAINGSPVDVPSAQSQLTWLKFSRWAGCPICNLHMACVKQRAGELRAAGISVVMVFHSPVQDVLDLRGDLPFTLVADPEKKHYKAFGIRGSLLFLAHKKAFNTFRSEAKLGNKAQRIHGGIFSLPADLLVGRDGQVIAVRYGTHADDNLEVDEVLEAAATQSKSQTHL